MYKKIVLITPIILFFNLFFSSTVFSLETNDPEYDPEIKFPSIFSSLSIMNIGYDREAASEYIIPLESESEIPLKIYYQIFGIFANWHAFKYRHRLMEIKLKIIEKPDWCIAEIKPSTLNVNIKANFNKPATTNVSLYVRVSDKAPALKMGNITIEATSPAIKGFFGLTKITDCKIKLDIPFVVGYLPIIDYKPEFTYKEISSLDVTKIPINITNNGNGPTEVLIKIEDIPDNWNITYPERILVGSTVAGEDNEAGFIIDVRPYKHFTKELINISFTPRYFADGSGPEGSPYVLGISLKNDGSYNGGNGFEISAIWLIVVIFILLLILGIVIKLRRKKE